jgi:hypothetical protein
MTARKVHAYYNINNKRTVKSSKSSDLADQTQANYLSEQGMQLRHVIQVRNNSIHCCSRSINGHQDCFDKWKWSAEAEELSKETGD